MLEELSAELIIFEHLQCVILPVLCPSATFSSVVARYGVAMPVMEAANGSST